MTGELTPLPAYTTWSWSRLRPQDFAWILFAAVLLFTSETNYDATILFILIAVFQIVEPRLQPFATKRGRLVSLTLKLVFCYLLLGWSHTIFSPYYPIFFVPVISAATTLELGGVLAVTAISCLAYFSFLLPIYIDWSAFELPPDYLSIMGLRAAFFAIVAVLVFEQAKAKRNEMERTEQAATSLRRAEASLRRSERLAALGQLTAGLAHELRNPLGTIRASAEMLSKPTMQSRPEVMTEMADNIRSEADRMNGLVGHFLDFARPLQIHPAAADFRHVIDTVFREQDTLAKQQSATLRVLGESSMPFVFDAGLLRLAISNLVQNALQASSPGKTVTVAYERIAGAVQITVSDEGSGIDAQQLENIFNPFFTTKPQGVGLGLAIVAKIVDEHGGRIRTTSKPGVGTRFEITLPFEVTV